MSNMTNRQIETLGGTAKLHWEDNLPGLLRIFQVYPYRLLVANNHIDDLVRLLLLAHERQLSVPSFRLRNRLVCLSVPSLSKTIENIACFPLVFREGKYKAIKQIDIVCNALYKIGSGDESSELLPLPMSGVTNSGEILGESHGFCLSEKKR
jgi:hypothetical protein